MEEAEGREKLAKEQNMTENCYLGKLGRDQLLAIWQYLPAKSILAFGMTCRRFRQLTDSESLWAWICRREFGENAVEAWLRVAAENQKLVGWKAIYHQMRMLTCVFCRQLTQTKAVPFARASHSLNIVSGTIVLYGGGCDGGLAVFIVHIGNGFGVISKKHPLDIPRKQVDLFARNMQCPQPLHTNHSQSNCVPGCFAAIPDHPNSSKKGPPDGVAMQYSQIQLITKPENSWQRNISRRHGRHLDDTWTAPVLDELADGVQWRQVKNGIPSGRFGQSCTVVGELLFLFGGINDNGERLNDTWVGHVLYDETSVGRVSWKLLEVAAAPVPRGAHAGCFAGDNKIVVYGGIGPHGIRLNDTWMLDFSEGQQPCWHEIETLLSPPPRSGHTLTWIGGNRMVLFGGRGIHFEVLNDVWMFDMEENYPAWVEISPYEPNPLDGIPTPRSGHSATPVFGGRVLIYGGEDASRSRKGDIWILDPMAGNSADSSASFTSSPGISVPDVVQKPLAHKMWKKLKQNGFPPRKRSFHGACAINSGQSIIIFGGMVDGELQPAGAVGLSFDDELYLLQLFP